MKKILVMSFLLGTFNVYSQSIDKEKILSSFKSQKQFVIPCAEKLIPTKNYLDNGEIQIGCSTRGPNGAQLEGTVVTSIGNKLSISHYKYGKIVGDYVEYSLDVDSKQLIITSKGQYFEGKKNGIWIEGDQSGKYIYGARVGVWKIGEDRTITYENGVARREHFFHGSCSEETIHQQNGTDVISYVTIQGDPVASIVVRDGRITAISSQIKALEPEIKNFKKAHVWVDPFKQDNTNYTNYVSPNVIKQELAEAAETFRNRLVLFCSDYSPKPEVISSDVPSKNDLPSESNDANLKKSGLVEASK